MHALSFSDEHLDELHKKFILWCIDQKHHNAYSISILSHAIAHVDGKWYMSVIYSQR